MKFRRWWQGYYFDGSWWPPGEGMRRIGNSGLYAGPKTGVWRRDPELARERRFRLVQQIVVVGAQLAYIGLGVWLAYSSK